MRANSRGVAIQTLNGVTEIALSFPIGMAMAVAAEALSPPSQQGTGDLPYLVGLMTLCAWLLCRLIAEKAGYRPSDRPDPLSFAYRVYAVAPARALAWLFSQALWIGGIIIFAGAVAWALRQLHG